MFKKIFSILIVLFFSQQLLIAETINVFEFNEDEMKTLKIRKIKGKTTYVLGSNANGNYLRADAEGKASGLGKELTINLLKTPFINITWKVEKDLSGIIENSKKGHDYAARVFVIKKNRSNSFIKQSHELCLF